MRLGLTLAPHLAPTLRDVVQLAGVAERAGFATLYVNEEHFGARSGYANAFAVAAAITAGVERACVAVQPLVGLDHPLRLIEQANLLDRLTQGRCLIVLAEADDAARRPFGLSRASLEALLDELAEAWAFSYEEDREALELGTEPYSGRMAGRIMPAPHSQLHPEVAIEATSEAGARLAARHCWPVQLAGVTPMRAEELMKTYRQALAGASQVAVDNCLARLTVRISVQAAGIAKQLAAFDSADIAELRLDPAPGLTMDELASGIKRQMAGSR